MNTISKDSNYLWGNDYDGNCRLIEGLEKLPVLFLPFTNEEDNYPHEDDIQKNPYYTYSGPDSNTFLENGVQIYEGESIILQDFNI